MALQFALLAAGAQAINSYLQQSDAVKAKAREVIAANNSIVDANLLNTVRTGYRVGLLNVQRGLQKRQMQQQGFDTSVAGTEFLAKSYANAAASGTIGASVEAVQLDTKMKMGEFAAQQADREEIAALNYNTQLGEITYQGISSLKSAVKMDLPSDDEILGGALLSGAVQFAGMYAMGQAKLGLGTPAGSMNPAAGMTSLSGATSNSFGTLKF